MIYSNEKSSGSALWFKAISMLLLVAVIALCINRNFQIIEMGNGSFYGALSIAMGVFLLSYALHAAAIGYMDGGRGSGTLTSSRTPKRLYITAASIMLLSCYIVYIGFQLILRT